LVEQVKKNTEQIEGIIKKRYREVNFWFGFG
jgi:hypothetical protein